MRRYKVYYDISSEKAYGADCAALANRYQPYIRFREKIEIDLQYLNSSAKDSSGAFNDFYTGFAGLSISSSAVVDNNYVHFRSAVSQTALTVGTPVSTIQLSGLSGAVRVAGSIELTNAAGATETVNYNAYSVSGSVYTFTLADADFATAAYTPSYAFAVNAAARVFELAIIKALAADIDMSNKATGRFIVRLASFNAIFADLIANAAAIDGAKFEHIVFDSDAVPILISQFDFLCKNTLTGAAGKPPAPMSVFYSKDEIDGLVSAGFELNFSVDGATDWHATQVAADRYWRFRRDPNGIWSDVIALIVGPQGVPGVNTWGSLTGTLADQADLTAALAAKAAAADLSTHTADKDNPHETTKAKVGLGNADNTSDADKPVSTAQQTALNGKADLVDGLIPASQLPSYVDDVLEYDNLAAFPATGETGKIYVAKDTNLTYRWGGTAYVGTSTSLALGETSSTAYRGDRGKTAYDHSQTTGNPHGMVKGDIGLGDAENKSSATIRGEITSANVTSALGYAPATAAQGAKADTALQVASNLADLNNAATARTNLGLGNVSNTADADKPISTATQTALDLKANAADVATDAELAAHTTRTDNPHAVTAAQVGKDTAQWNADKLQGRTVASTAPADKQGLVWNATNSQWEPGAAGHIIQDAGTAKTQRDNLNFAGFKTTDDAANNATKIELPDAPDAVTFTNSDLASGILTINHAFGEQRALTVICWDNSGKAVVPDIAYVSSGVLSADFSGYGTLTGTWYYRVSLGGAVSAGASGGSSSGGGTITDNPQTADYTQTETGQQIRYTAATAAARTLTLMSPPANGSAPTWIRNESTCAITLSGAINGSASATFALASGCAAQLVSDGTYWRVARLVDNLPDISDAVAGKPVITASNLVSLGGLSRWTLNNVLTDAFGSRELTNSGLSFATDSAFPLGTRSVLACDGSHYLSFTPTGLPSGTGARTVCCWIKTTATNGPGIFTWGAYNAGQLQSFALTTGGYLCVAGHSGGYTVSATSGAVNDGNWHFVAYTFDGTTCKIYRDGTQVATGTPSWNTALSSGVVGLYGTDFQDYRFSGRLADIRVYNRALSASELSTVYAGDAGTTWQLSASAAARNLAGRSVTAPTIAAGTGAGTSPTVSVEGSDASGKITVTTGASPTASAVVATVTFASTMPNTPYCVLTPANAAAAALSGNAQVYATSTTSTLTITVGSTALAASTQYIWNFHNH